MIRRSSLPVSCCLALALTAGSVVEAADGKASPWHADAVWYQIFPERFRNGDPANDPGRSTLEWPIHPGEDWAISPWTGDWYARAPWETALGESFYDDGVFHRRYGGDLKGVIDKLDYLADLGVTAIYFNPVFYARSLHKYDGSSFHHIDPNFGPDPAGDLALMKTETADPRTWKWTSADKLFLELIQQAHARGIRVIIDGVFNHTGRDFFAFQDVMRRQQASPYKDWYGVDEWNDPATARNEFRYHGWWGHATLPEFANTPDGKNLHPGPKAYIFAITKRWMDPNGDGKPDDGVDGWRLDVADEVPAGFWAEWNQLVRKLNPNVFTAGEKWDDSVEFIKDTGFSAVMNYYAFTIPVKGFLIDGKLSAGEFGRMLDERRKAHGPAVQYAMMNLMDSHDTERVASMIANRTTDYIGDASRFDFDNGNVNSIRSNPSFNLARPDAATRSLQRMVALFQVTYLGAPMFYYGTESGMWGGDDPDDRQPMVWKEFTYVPQTAHPRGGSRNDDINFDPAVFDFYRSVLRLRRQHPALSRGDFRVIHANDEGRTFGFERTLDGRTVIAVFNRSESEREVSLDNLPTSAVVLLGTLPADQFALSRTGTQATLRLPPLSAVVLGQEAGQ